MRRLQSLVLMSVLLAGWAISSRSMESESLNAVAKYSPELNADEILVIVALQKHLDRRSNIGCLNPHLATTEIDESDRLSAEESLREAGDQIPNARQVKQKIADEQHLAWAGVEKEGEILSSETARAIASAYADLAVSAPRRAPEATLVGSELSGIILKTDCLAKLHRPIVHGNWAFVERSSFNAGFLYALSRDASSGWRVIGVRGTWIA